MRAGASKKQLCDSVAGPACERAVMLLVGHVLQRQDAAFATKMLWIVATRYYAPRRWEAYASLFETLTQLDF